jgi:hypothetical protein
MRAGNFYNGLLGSPKLPKLGTGKCPFSCETQVSNWGKARLKMRITDKIRKFPESFGFFVALFNCFP